MPKFIWSMTISVIFQIRQFWRNKNLETLQMVSIFKENFALFLDGSFLKMTQNMRIFKFLRFYGLFWIIFEQLPCIK